MNSKNSSCQLSKVWQVVEEPDFPWVGYRADKYNLEIRSELLTTLEAINQTLRDLELETEDFSAKLGVFPPETFARIQWLLDVSNLLFESPKPEQFWMTNHALDKLLAEAKAYLETSLWIKQTRADLMERYNPALFDLALSRSQEMQQAITTLGKSSSNPKHQRRRIPCQTRKIPSIHQKHPVNRSEMA